MIFSKVMSTALKQPDDTQCRMRVDIALARDLPTLGRRFSGSLQRLLARDHGQLNSLFIFAADFSRGLKTPFSYIALKALAMSDLVGMIELLESKSIRPDPPLSNTMGR